MTLARIGHGASFLFGDGASPEVFTAFAEVKGITAPNTEIDILDATHMASPNAFREFVQGLADGGQMRIRMNYLAGSTTDAAILARQPGGASAGDNNYQIRIAAITGLAAQTMTVRGILEGYERDIEVGEVMESSIMVKVTGAVLQADTA